MNVIVALGSNVASCAGSPRETLHAAIVELMRKGLQVLATSRFYESPAWPDSSDPPFINAVSKIQTDLPPTALLACLHEIERGFGRERGARNAPRTLDLDIIDCDGKIVDGSLTLPHPRMSTRGFVLIPLRDVAPDWRHPITGKTVSEMIAELPPDERNLPAAKD
ncbi:MAG TPA: 2-amino-4-hydroxy-6-hydroxymethyldihydropteridine diphosphokinase [Rhizomicrobium sp.]|jgi:2-amino-4-hydroxy-6-hydroxymethyldihydropteridine diphosphokinase